MLLLSLITTIIIIEAYTAQAEQIFKEKVLPLIRFCAELYEIVFLKSWNKSYK